MPAMWLHWQEFITGISLMCPSGGGAHIHIILSYSCAGFTSTQLWGITRQMDNTHFADNSEEKLRGAAQVTISRPHLKDWSCLFFDGRDTTSSCETRRWHGAGESSGQPPAGLDVRRQLNYQSAWGEAVSESLISGSPMQVTPIIHLKNRPAWLLSPSRVTFNG